MSIFGSGPNKKQLQLFEALHQSRTEDFKTFNKKSYRGVWSSIIDKYPESAHFVYELLQNADDAEATSVEITVNSKEMLFKHNGTKHFDVTTEDAVPVGDINSITGIGDSSKNNGEESNQNKIGKFGVGFKAVFQYTTTPEIYDDIFKFKIENYIIPTMLKSDHCARKSGETLFVFPFKDGEKSFDEITKRLDKLQNPILFLRHLEKILLRIDKKGNGKYETISYEKILEESVTYDDGIILLRFKLKEPLKNTSIFLFTQPITVKSDGKITSHYINVGFYYDSIQNKLITDTVHNIFCFFPTKETFKTCFVCHAPFLLTDNRQNLKPGEGLNKDLIRLLSELATTAVVKLRDYGKTHKNLLINENLTEIIPVYKNDYWHDLDELFELPMKNAFDSIVEDEPLFLSRNGKYLTASQSCIGKPKELVDLLNKSQLNSLFGNDEDDDDLDEEKDFLNWSLAQNIDKLDGPDYTASINEYTSSDFARDITSEFMSQQNLKWVTRFYTFLRTAAPKLWKVTSADKLSNYSSLPFRIAPIIKIQNGKWVAPYLNDKSRNVYLPLKKGAKSKYNFVSEEYLKEEMAKKFFDELDIKEPDEYDYINTVILGKYRGESIAVEQEDVVSDLEVIIKYYNKIRRSLDCTQFLDLVKENLYFHSEDSYFRTASSLYFPNPQLKLYFSGNSGLFFDESYYKPYIKQFDWQEVCQFLSILGISRYPKIEETNKPYYSLYSFSISLRRQISADDWSEYSFQDKELEGFSSVVQTARMNKEISLYIWNELLPALNYSCHGQMTIKYRKKYARYNSYTYCDSSFKDDLIHLAWIFTQDGKMLSADEIALEDLAFEYNRDNGLIEFLRIEKKEKSIVELGGTEEQQNQLDLGKRIQAVSGDLSEQEILQAIAEANARKRQRNPSMPSSQESTKANDEKNQNSSSSLMSQEEKDLDLEQKLKEKWEKKAQEQNRRPHAASQKGDDDGFPSINTQPESKENGPFFDEKNTSSSAGINSEKDDSSADRKLKSKNTEAQESAQQASELVQILDLLKATEKYTFKWYKLLMELMHANKSNVADRHVQLDFSEWEFTCSDKLLHLSNPSQPVPSWIAEADRSVITTLSDKSAIINGLIVKADEYGVDISIEFSNELETICKKARKIRIVADNSSSFVDSFERRFLQLGFEDEYNLSKNLPSDITFIYGPPGTGKTTEVVRMVHDIISDSSEKKNILVLTPTNKAADVVAEKMVDDDECFSYLTRFGSTESLMLIEDAAVVSNRDTTDMDLMDHNILVTTAARYAYDCVQPDDTILCDYVWDYIIIDEASMMDLLTVTYILFKGAESKIIISGDPMQIQPVAQNDMPAYNVYDLVGLHGFADAIKNYKRYPVIALQTQHRSIPVIGNLVSKFSYNGLVQTDPNRLPQKPLKLDGIEVRDINFLGFNVAEFDLITGLTAVSGSAFNLYAAIFTYKMAEYTVSQISKRYSKNKYSIGIVCPYKAEADAIKQMLESRPISQVNCTVSCGTVHSFQGDECDIMFVVLNPPAQCSKGSHINNHNIINVAISRARDYLFFVLPTGQQKGFTLKNDLGRILTITQRQILNCSKLEEVMFGSSNYIYSNTHVTCHMPVNVYCEENAVYEVRMSDDALDIKINE